MEASTKQAATGRHSFRRSYHACLGLGQYDYDGHSLTLLVWLQAPVNVINTRLIGQDV